MFSRAELLQQARQAALHAHCPYSHFRVGAALVAGEQLFVGVHVESSSYGLTLCSGCGDRRWRRPDHPTGSSLHRRTRDSCPQ
jgi:hypothetical protein